MELSSTQSGREDGVLQHKSNNNLSIKVANVSQMTLRCAVFGSFVSFSVSHDGLGDMHVTISFPS
jgi:hypothetical protein